MKYFCTNCDAVIESELNIHGTPHSKPDDQCEGYWVGEPQDDTDDIDRLFDEMLADAEAEERIRQEYYAGRGFGMYHHLAGDDSGPDFWAMR